MTNAERNDFERMTAILECDESPARYCECCGESYFVDMYLINGQVNCDYCKDGTMEFIRMEGEEVNVKAIN